jgi:hypothetical protein
MSHYSGFPPPTGLRAHIQLARVLDYITSNIYRDPAARPSASTDESVSHVERAAQMLTDWRSQLPPELRISEDVYADIPDRGTLMLNMMRNQLLILTLRPIFFSAVKKSVAERFVKRHWRIEDHAHILLIRRCGDAARCNLRIAAKIYRISPGGKLLHADLHHIFNAAIMLMLHQIAFVNLRTLDVNDIGFAIDAFQREADTGSSYGIDCLKVLRDLQALTQALRRMMFETAMPAMEPGPGEGIWASLGGGSGSGASSITAGDRRSTSAVPTPSPAVLAMHSFGGEGLPGDAAMELAAVQVQSMGQGNAAIMQELMAWTTEPNTFQQLGANSYLAS